jgi:hypothetical protein
MKKLIFFSSIFFLFAVVAFGHVIPREKIVEYLNSKEVREEAGIERAAQNEKLPRLLIIEVNEKWYKLSETDRKNFAKKWYSIWRHTVHNGVVSVLDKDKGDPVVNFSPDGRVALTR